MWRYITNPQTDQLPGRLKVKLIVRQCESKVSKIAGFVRVLENLESPGIFLWHLPGLESPGKWLLVLESAGNLLSSSEKYKMYGRQ